MAWHVPDKYRIRRGSLATVSQDDFGSFLLPPKIGSRALFCIASPYLGWEHVSVSIREGKNAKTPTWDEMSHIKSIFWDDEDVVMQLHPRRSEYVNNHPNVLHLWRPLNAEIPLPPSEFVGIKGEEGESYRRAMEERFNGKTR